MQVGSRHPTQHPAGILNVGDGCLRITGWQRHFTNPHPGTAQRCYRGDHFIE